MYYIHVSTHECVNKEFMSKTASQAAYIQWYSPYNQNMDMDRDLVQQLLTF